MNRTMQDYSTTDLYDIAVKRANKIGNSVIIIPSNNK
jgi:hypothetical protein